MQRRIRHIQHCKQKLLLFKLEQRFHIFKDSIKNAQLGVFLFVFDFLLIYNKWCQQVFCLMGCENPFTSVEIDTYGASNGAVLNITTKNKSPDLRQEGMRIY